MIISHSITLHHSQVLNGRVVSVSMDNATARAAMSYSNALRFAVEYNPSTTSSSDAFCVRWAPELASNNGAWTTRDCRLSSTTSLSTGRGSTLTCECSSIDAEHMAVLVPRTEGNNEAVAAVDQIGFVILLASSFALVVVYVMACIPSF